MPKKLNFYCETCTFETKWTTTQLIKQGTPVCPNCDTEMEEDWQKPSKAKKKTQEEEKYLIVGNNDYWYSYLVGTKKEAMEDLKTIKAQIKKHQWRDIDDSLGEPTELTLYKVKYVARAEL